MRNNSWLLVAIILLSILSTSAYAQTTAARAINNLPRLSDTRHKVLVLGSTHFDQASNASDWKSKKNLNMLSPEKQVEIEQVVKALAAFRPTKICIEWLPNQDSAFNRRYQQYLAGSWNLAAGEYYQIGFRLAKMMGHQKLYCIDNKPEQPSSLIAIDDFDKYLSEEGSISDAERKKVDSLNEKFNLYVDSMKYVLPLRDLLKFVNSDELKRESKRLWFTGLVHAGNQSTYAGADLTGSWYQRNTRIFSNVKKLCTEPEERILIIYGLNHAFILEEAFKASQQFDVVPVKSMLR